MKKSKRKTLLISICSLAGFALWTVAIRLIDVRAIGPWESAVGFATLNGFVHNLTGVNFTLYTVTDWLGLIPIAVCAGFGLLGLIQWIKRKKLSQVDYSILVLGGFYAVVTAVYVLFEFIVINYRPVLINGILEASYPSSTTVLVMCVMPTAIMQFKNRIKNKKARSFVTASIVVFIAFTVIGRLVSGVHWVTDIIGGALLSVGLVALYRFFSEKDFS